MRAARGRGGNCHLRQKCNCMHPEPSFARPHQTPDTRQAPGQNTVILHEHPQPLGGEKKKGFDSLEICFVCRASLHLRPALPKRTLCAKGQESFDFIVLGYRGWSFRGGVVPTSIYRFFFSFCGGVKVWGWRSVKEGIQVSVPANCRAFAEVTVRSRDACFFFSFGLLSGRL